MSTSTNPNPLPTHTHHTQYADPVVRHPSPASSVGTTYPVDQTSFSDSEAQLSQPAFERKRELEIELHLPRREEMRADGDPLLSLSTLLPLATWGGAGAGGGGGRPVRYGERKLDPVEEKLVLDKIMDSLRAEISKLEEDEQFEQILQRGSKAALEAQPSTNDIDLLMRSMMGPSLDLNISGKSHMGVKATTTTSTDGGAPSTGAAEQRQRETIMTNGPWNNFGEMPAAASVAHERRESMLIPASDSFLSGTTAGKRSRNGTSRKL